MGFKENLKSELLYKGVLVKELAARSGISNHTINNYLSTSNCIPTAENAVKIARVLDVSVEYLITGEAAKPSRPALNPDIRIVTDTMKRLDGADQKMILNLALAMKEKQEAKNQPVCLHASV
ncbi:MAG: helix-turn-helix domain-containing protein [Treponema sp.]|jgi:transcriptional regulator with XRE-family HTH domain|nr:helix-turn-helix domain-containing protein [Treponema sp.]